MYLVVSEKLFRFKKLRDYKIAQGWSINFSQLLSVLLTVFGRAKCFFSVLEFDVGFRSGVQFEVKVELGMLTHFYNLFKFPGRNFVWTDSQRLKG